VVYCSFESNSHKEALAVAIWNVPISSRHIGCRSVRTTFTTINVRKKMWNAIVASQALGLWNGLWRQMAPGPDDAPWPVSPDQPELAMVMQLAL